MPIQTFKFFITKTIKYKCQEVLNFKVVFLHQKEKINNNKQLLNTFKDI